MFVVDSSRLLSFAVGYSVEKERCTIVPFPFGRLRLGGRDEAKRRECSGMAGFLDRFVPRDDVQARLYSLQNGNANARLGWAGRQSQNAEGRLQGQTKRLTFREGRLRLPTGTTRLESQAIRLLCGGLMVLALTFWSFLVKQKGQENECVPRV